MYTMRTVLLLLQFLALAEASVKWTLHSSCYKDDEELEKAFIDAVQIAKDFAKRGSSKLKESRVPLIGGTIKNALMPLMSKGSYSDNVKDVIGKFDKLEQLEGPIGLTADAGGRFDASDAWKKLKESDDHYLNFLYVCRPSLVDRPAPPGSLEDTLPYDTIRQYQFQNKATTLGKMLEQEGSIADWDSIQGEKTKALTSVEAEKPTGGRMRIPETITFHPLWIKYQRGQKFFGWTDELFAEVTHKDAPEVFRNKGVEKKSPVEIVPMDGLLEASFAKTIFHEFFHLTAFGGMEDERGNNAYTWLKNVENQNHNNPEFLAIVAVVIELLERKGGNDKRYKVDAKGAVKERK